MEAKILKVPLNQAIATATIGFTDEPTDEIEDVFNQLEIEQDDSYKEIFDDGVMEMFNNQFKEMIFESNLN